MLSNLLLEHKGNKIEWKKCDSINTIALHRIVCMEHVSIVLNNSLFFFLLAIYSKTFSLKSNYTEGRKEFFAHVIYTLIEIYNKIKI